MPTRSIAARSLPVALVLILAACAAPSPGVTSPAPASPLPGAMPSVTPTPIPSPTETLVPTPTPTLPPAGAFMQGMVYNSHWRGIYSHPGSDWILSDIVRPMGVNWIQLKFTCYQADARSTEISCPGREDVPSDEDLAHVVRTAHGLGMRVMLEPAIWLTNDRSHSAAHIGMDFNEPEWQAWFASYTEMINHYAVLAERTGIDFFSLGQELGSAARRDAEWRQVAASVRQVYRGPITFSLDDAPLEGDAASSGSYPGEANWLDLTWWDAVDAIGIHPYGALAAIPPNATAAEIQAAWAPVVENLEALSQKWDRPVIITELGYPSIEGGCQQPNNTGLAGNIDLQAQADCYQGAIDAFAGRDWFRGIFWWSVEALGVRAGPDNVELSPYNKPAEDVLRRFYGVPPRPTPTPIPEANPRRALDVYVDELGVGWGSQPGPDMPVDFEQTAVALSGRAVEVRNLMSLWLGHGALDTLGYDWLEFYLFAPETVIRLDFWPFEVPVRIAVNLTMAWGELGSPSRPISVEISQSPFIEGGQLLPGRWQRVRIPLDTFGPDFGQPLLAIDFSNATVYSLESVPIYLDEIRFLAD